MPAAGSAGGLSRAASPRRGRCGTSCSPSVPGASASPTTGGSGSVTRPSAGWTGPSGTSARRRRTAIGMPSSSICSADSRLDDSTPSRLTTWLKLVRELRAEGLAESTIVIVIGVTNRVYRYAARRLGWAGANPVSFMLSSERPKPSQSKRRRVFEAGELEETIAAATEPFRTLFILAALTGARLSELLGLSWADVRIADLDEAEIEFSSQVDRHGIRRPTKTDGSARTVPIPRELAVIMKQHREASIHSSPADFVFSTRSGRALGQRNVGRALRSAQTKATRPDGSPTFPVLHETDEHGRPVVIPHGAVPSMHSFRHTVASRALLAGESIDEVAFLLGHRDANVTRAVYVRELSDARRRTMRRSRMIAEFSDVLGAHDID